MGSKMATSSEGSEKDKAQIDDTVKEVPTYASILTGEEIGPKNCIEENNELGEFLVVDEENKENMKEQKLIGESSNSGEIKESAHDMEVSNSFQVLKEVEGENIEVNNEIMADNETEKHQADSSSLFPNAVAFKPIPQFESSTNKSPMEMSEESKTEKNGEKKEKKKLKEIEQPPQVTKYQNYVPFNNTLEDLMGDYNLDSSCFVENDNHSSDDQGNYSDCGAKHINKSNLSFQRHSMVNRGNRVKTK